MNLAYERLSPTEKIMVDEIRKLLKKYDPTEPYITNTALRIIDVVQQYKGSL